MFFFVIEINGRLKHVVRLLREVTISPDEKSNKIGLAK